ncbi:hypothetical protein BK025_12140 [Sodalis sp. TME1]|nr:hypothetical protein BK025_12140 [Sodalis sp. TME1]
MSPKRWRTVLPVRVKSNSLRASSLRASRALLTRRRADTIGTSNTSVTPGGASRSISYSTLTFGAVDTFSLDGSVRRQPRGTFWRA